MIRRINIIPLFFSTLLLFTSCKEEEISITSTDNEIKDKIIKSTNIQNNDENISVHQNFILELNYEENEIFDLDGKSVYYEFGSISLKFQNDRLDYDAADIINNKQLIIDFKDSFESGHLDFFTNHELQIGLVIYDSETNEVLKGTNRKIYFQTYKINKYYENMNFSINSMTELENDSVKKIDKYLIPIIELEEQLNVEKEFDNGFKYKYKIDSIYVLNQEEESIKIDTTIFDDNIIAIYSKEEFLFKENDLYSVSINLMPYELINGEWTPLLTKKNIHGPKFNFIPIARDTSTQSLVILEPQETDTIPVNQPLFLKLDQFYKNQKFIKVTPRVKNSNLHSDGIEIPTEYQEKFNEYMKIYPSENYKANSSLDFNFDAGFQYNIGDFSISKYLPELSGLSYSFIIGSREISIIDTTSIKNSYPLIRQRNYFKKDSDDGFINLKNLTNEVEQLIINASNYTISFVGNSDSISEPATFSLDELKLTFKIPNQQLNNNEIYKLKLFTDASLIFEDYFRTSEFNSFTEKIQNPDFYNFNSFRKENSNYKIMTSNMGFNEGLDENEYKCLSAIAIIEKTKWFTERCIPLFYNLLKYDEFTIENRDTTEFGVPPRKAIYLNIKPKFLNENEISNNSLQELNRDEKTLQTSIDYHYLVGSDYTTLRNQASNCDDCIEDMEKVENLRNSVFPYNWKGIHYFEINYKNPITGQLQSTNEEYIEIFF